MAFRLLKIIFLSLLASCTNVEEVELELVSQKLYSFSEENIGVTDTLNIVKYKLTNKSNNNYFLNLNKHEVIPSITFDNYTKSLHIYDKLTNKEVKYSQNSINNFSDVCANCNMSFENKVDKNPLLKDINKNYLFPNRNSQIFIHAGETLYFESLVKIQAFLPVLNDINVDVAHIEKGKSYHAKMILHVFQKSINSFDWQTRARLKENNFKIYSKNIYSKNFIPIEIID